MKKRFLFPFVAFAVTSSQVYAQAGEPTDPRTECYHQCTWENLLCTMGSGGGYAGWEACDLQYNSCTAGCDAIGFNAISDKAPVFLISSRKEQG